jgi:hypothetical protein
MQTKLVEIFQIGSEPVGILNISEKYWPTLGQYLPCQLMDGQFTNLPTHLFRVFGDEDRLNLNPIPVHWQPGDQLLVGEPQGQGFCLPREARRVALVPYKVPSTRLLALLRAALDQNAAVSLFSETVPPPEIMHRLPYIVEVSPLNSLLDNLDWPDFLAGDLERDNLDTFSELFLGTRVSFDGQVLVRTEMPCRGMGECGVCTVKTTKGTHLACLDGPVFPLKELLHVAQ